MICRNVYNVPDSLQRHQINDSMNVPGKSADRRESGQGKNRADCHAKKEKSCIMKNIGIFQHPFIRFPCPL